MSKVRVLVGTRKGAFILTSDGARKRWKVSGPHFAGWEIRTASTRRKPAAGLGRSLSAQTTAAKPGTRPAAAPRN